MTNDLIDSYLFFYPWRNLFLVDGVRYSKNVLQLLGRWSQSVAKRAISRNMSRDYNCPPEPLTVPTLFFRKRIALTYRPKCTCHLSKRLAATDNCLNAVKRTLSENLGKQSLGSSQPRFSKNLFKACRINLLSTQATSWATGNLAQSCVSSCIQRCNTHTAH